MQWWRGHALLDGGVEEADERCERLEGAQQLRVEALARGERRFELAKPEELFVAQVVARRVIPEVAAGHPCESIALQLAQHRAELAPHHHPMQLRVRDGNP